MDAIETSDPTTPGETLYMSLAHYRVDRRDISFLRFILEAYEGGAVLTTVEAENGIISVKMAPGRECEIKALLDRLAAEGEILLEPLEDYSLDREGLA